MSYNIEMSNIIPFLAGFELINPNFFTDEDIDTFIGAIDWKKTGVFDYEFGATKLVIIPANYDFVIKIPFNGGWSSYSCEYEYFKCENYCEEEIDIYYNAKDNGFEQFFFPLKEIEYKNNIVYIQEKVDNVYCDEETKAYSNYDSKQIILDSRSKHSGRELSYALDKLPLDWEATCLDTLNGDILAFEDFIRFLSEYGIINDLHEGNIGYKNGHPVIFDYGGYYEDL